MSCAICVLGPGDFATGGFDPDSTDVDLPHEDTVIEILEFGGTTEGVPIVDNFEVGTIGDVALGEDQAISGLAMKILGLSD